MLDEAKARQQRVMRAIEAYLARCPSAADNEQGIAQWWLPEMGEDAPPAEVRLALDTLVHSGVLTRTSLPDGSVIYRAAAGAARP